jgi:hypothetical protein
MVSLLLLSAATAAAAPTNSIPAIAAIPGRETAVKYCSACHLFPEPDTLPKTAWLHHILPDMAKWLGVERADYESMPDGRLLEAAALFPPSPLVSDADWLAIWDYYRAAAPDRVAPPPARPTAKPGLKQFRVRKLNYGGGAPMVSLVRIDPAGRRLFAGDAFAGLLAEFDARGELRSKQRLGKPPIGLAFRPDGVYATLIGKFFPSDQLEGAVIVLPAKAEAEPPRLLLDKLRRPTDTAIADLNGDGRDDLVVCAYGHRLGSFSWFENAGAGRYHEHVLLDRPGAVRVEVRDFNHDGQPDLLVLMAQAREGLWLFRNEGGGRFSPQPIVEQPPTFGYAGFEVADFNGDGHPDLLTANGDNGDWPTGLKSSHGLRLLLNDGKNRFEEKWFFPLHGAYKAVARDFDGDGDLDVAAIAFYPDFERGLEESFVYLENQGALRFETWTMANSAAGRWLTMDAGDLDGDGDEDIALGSFVRGPTTQPIPSAAQERWRADGAAVLLLENTRRSPAR